MDMTYNRNTTINLRYTGQYQWGEAEARLYNQNTRHKMDMGPDRYYYGTGMPMDTKGRTRGAQVQGNIIISENDTLRVGAEYQYYSLNDWWPPVGGIDGAERVLEYRLRPAGKNRYLRRMGSAMESGMAQPGG